MFLHSISVGIKKMRKWSMVGNNKWDSALLAILVSLLLCCVTIHKYSTPNFKGNKILEVFANITQEDFLKLHDQYILMYNRIPKTGSTSMLHMLRALEENNQFRGPISLNCQPLPAYCQSMNMSQQMMYAKRLTNEKMKNFPKPIIFQNHVHYIDFTKLISPNLLKQPIYFNTVRDPYDRFKSKYYYLRKGLGGKRFRSYHLLEPDSDPRGRDYWEWKNKTFEDCVMDFNDKECHISNGSIRDYAIARSCNIDKN